MKKFFIQEIDCWFNHHLLPNSRTIYLGNESADCVDPEEEVGITCEIARRFIKGLHYLQYLGDADITIIMNSSGGDWTHGMAIYDAIRQCPCSVTIISVASACSMSSVVLQAGDYRILASNAGIMIHDGFMGSAGIPSSVINSIQEEAKRNLPTLYNIYYMRIKETKLSVIKEIMNTKLLPSDKKIHNNFSIENVQAICQRDTFFSAKEAIELNLVDRIMIEGDLAGAFVNPVNFI